MAAGMVALAERGVGRGGEGGGVGSGAGAVAGQAWVAEARGMVMAAASPLADQPKAKRRQRGWPVVGRRSRCRSRSQASHPEQGRAASKRAPSMAVANWPAGGRAPKRRGEALVLASAPWRARPSPRTSSRCRLHKLMSALQQAQRCCRRSAASDLALRPTS